MWSNLKSYTLMLYKDLLGFYRQSLSQKIKVDDIELKRKKK